jgi:hypothetical protein
MSQPETVIAIYKPKPGSEAPLMNLVRTHVPRLRELGLATEMQPILLRSPKDGTLLEIFDWRDKAAVEAAHSHPEVLAMWTLFGNLCDFISLGDLEESSVPFPHFERVNLE